jgi:hypothetical protein
MTLLTTVILRLAYSLFISGFQIQYFGKYYVYGYGKPSFSKEEVK